MVSNPKLAAATKNGRYKNKYLALASKRCVNKLMPITDKTMTSLPLFDLSVFNKFKGIKPNINNHSH